VAEEVAALRRENALVHAAHAQQAAQLGRVDAIIAAQTVLVAALRVYIVSRACLDPPQGEGFQTNPPFFARWHSLH